MIRITKPKFSRTLKYLQRLTNFDPGPILEEYGRRGVVALSNATPKDTGDTARAWDYKVERKGAMRYRLVWTNSEEAGDAPLVILLQYGHQTKSGWYISGYDFINPALAPIYEGLNESLIREVLA